MSKAFTLEKSQKKCFLFMACTPVYFIVYGICGTSLQFIQNSNPTLGERGGSVVECRTPEREVRGSRPTAAVLCP